MLYTVEVHRIGGDLPGLMSQMRSWLDHRRFEPDSFRYSIGSPRTTFRLEFKIEAEAIAFAKAFGGRILGSSDYADAVVPRPRSLHDKDPFASTAEPVMHRGRRSA